MFCSSCGAEISPKNTVCPQCARNLASGAPEVGLAPKNRLIYLLLALFTGNFGLHNFYAGYIGRGAVQLLLTLLIIPAFAVSIWAFFEMFLVTRDARGVPFSDRGIRYFILGVLLYILLLLLLFAAAIAAILPQLNVWLLQVQNVAQMAMVNTALHHYSETFDAFPAAPDREGLQVLAQWGNQNFIGAHREQFEQIDWERYHYIGNDVAYHIFQSYEDPPLLLSKLPPDRSAQTMAALASGAVVTMDHQENLTYATLLKQLFSPTVDWKVEPYRTLLKNANNLKD